MMKNLYKKIRELKYKGVEIVDPRQIYISSDVDIDRINKGCVLFPGVRLSGKNTFIGSYAQIGTEGPVTICDSIIGKNVEIASGFISQTTLLSGVHVGANCHFRAGTILEENVCTGHAVGLKHSILMYSVAVGSLINFCDALISGGRSRSEHSEIGSGFIHFNFTPWGKNGDKATPSLIGNVTEGVFLDQSRIFIGGLSGMVGPNKIGFGTTTVAGQVIRKSIESSTLYSEMPIEINKPLSSRNRSFMNKHIENVNSRNIEYISQLCALRKWYTEIRLRRSLLQNDLELSNVLEGAIGTLLICIRERICQYNKFASEWKQPLIDEEDLNVNSTGCNLQMDWKLDLEYDKWIWNLSANDKTALSKWISNYANSVKAILIK